MLNITQEAKNYLCGITKEHNKEYIAFGVKGGGCSGFSYIWDFSDGPLKEDEIIDIDGIRLQNSLGWFLIRASNTQNQLTCRVESTTRENLFLLKKIVEDQLSKSGVNYNIII